MSQHATPPACPRCASSTSATAGTLLTRVLDLVTVKDLLGHADLKTTERYLHAIRASELADAANRAFTPLAVTPPTTPPSKT